MMHAMPWVTYPQGRAAPGAPRVLLFPCAGGAASMFRSWLPHLPKAAVGAPVHLPGREARIREPAARRLDALLGPLLEGLRPHLQPPVVLAGYSMGALIAYEVARRMEAEGRGPAALVAMAFRAPHLPLDREPVHGMADAPMRAHLMAFGGTPTEVLEHPELLDLLLPVLRCDLEVCETYRHAPGPPLRCPVLAYGGRDDPDVLPHHVEAWAPLAGGRFKARIFEGHHFFIQGREAEVLSAMAADLRAAGALP